MSVPDYRSAPVHITVENKELEPRVDWTARLTAGAALLTAVATIVYAVFTGKQIGLLQRQLEIQLSTTRPFLSISPVVKITKTHVMIAPSVVNTSNIPARIVTKVNQGWNDGQMFPPTNPDITRLSFVAHNEPIYLSSFNIEPVDQTVAQLWQMYLDGKSCFEIASCIIYKSVDEGDPRHWKLTARFTYNYRWRMFYALEQYEKMTSATEICEIGPPQSCTSQPKVSDQ